MTNKRVLAAVGGIGATAVLGLGLWLGNGVMSTSQVGLVSHSDRGPAPSKAPNQPAAPEQPRS
ncbi:MAG TPA: hypothetical protein VGP70_07840 [Actinomadura sp.]|jgi:hypothetical protein|nr:hypothetical protein [Actinomadura sp.]